MKWSANTFSNLTRGALPSLLLAVCQMSFSSSIDAAFSSPKYVDDDESS